MWKIVILGLLGIVVGEKVTYQKYKVYRLIPSENKQLEEIENLRTTGYSFWKDPSQVNNSVDIMVSPDNAEHFQSFINRVNLPYEKFIDDVQSLIDNEALSMSVMNRESSRYSNFDFTNYHTLDEIYNYLDDLAKTYPDKVKILTPGRTSEGRLIKGVEVTFGKNNSGIFIESGIHAREWITPATTLYILDQLLHSKDVSVRDIAERHNWFIFPTFNPDGFVYTHEKNRLWRKSRKPYGFCTGVDLNRNWGYKWMTGGASPNPCSDTYAGPAAYSEIETKTMSDYIKSISNRFYIYISFHSYSQLLLFPYGYTTEHLDNYNEQYNVGRQTIKALARRYGTRYVTGSIADTIYIASGNTVDWIKGNFRTPLTYTYELRDTGFHGFILPAKLIVPTGEETLDSLVAMIKGAQTYGYPKKI